VSRVILITGASRGIGEMLYQHFRGRGVETFGTFHGSSLDSSALDRVDVTSFADVEGWVKKRLPEGSQPVLINCAGITYNSMTHTADPSQWRAVIDVNLVGTFHTVRSVLPAMRAAGYGRIINFASVVGQKGAIGASAYAASKAGLVGLTKTVSLENAAKGITINNINLGYFNIGMIDKVPEKLLSKIVEQIPVGRLGEPQNIVKAVEFLIEASDVTGASLDLNGGLL
jgi:NAD(P)-dependent dehydrogenase (short-subunit alcohol dehydrogenase family)